jgi:cytochrome P450
VLVEAWKDGLINDDELLGYLYGFVTAGTDTTGTSFVNAFSLLAEFGQLEYTRSVSDDADAMRKIVEEILRYGTPFPTKPLLVRKEVRFGDLTIPPRSVLNIWFAAANRDPAVSGGKPGADPNEFDPRRWPNRHLALGWGKHFCLGGDLSRLETRILLQESLYRLPELELATDRPFERFAGIVDGVTEAYFRFDRDVALRIMEAEGEPHATPVAQTAGMP